MHSASQDDGIVRLQFQPLRVLCEYTMEVARETYLTWNTKFAKSQNINIGVMN